MGLSWRAKRAKHLLWSNKGKLALAFCAVALCNGVSNRLEQERQEEPHGMFVNGKSLRQFLGDDIMDASQREREAQEAIKKNPLHIAAAKKLEKLGYKEISLSDQQTMDMHSFCISTTGGLAFDAKKDGKKVFGVVCPSDKDPVKKVKRSELGM